MDSWDVQSDVENGGCGLVTDVAYSLELLKDLLRVPGPEARPQKPEGVHEVAFSGAASPNQNC
jgi:hypothetical protein